MNKTFRQVLGLFALLWTLPALADLQGGLDWLRARDAAGGVHRSQDLAGAVDTNAEAWLSLHLLGATQGVPGLAAVAAEQADESTLSRARQVLIKLQQGSSGDQIIAGLLREQRADGGFSSHAQGGSDALSTAWVLLALDRAGRGAQTPAQRALAWLLASQRADGGWPANSASESSLWISAQVARTLQAYATRFALSASLTKSRNYMLSRQRADHSFGELFETAQALDALVALAAERTAIDRGIAQLAGLQLANGSFADDAYQTALALRALHAHAQPVIDPTMAQLRGRVIAADTELPITGASLVLSGAGSSTITSNNSGELHADNLPGGQYQATLSYAGMQSVSFEFTVPGGRAIDLGTLRMYQRQGIGNPFGVIRGRTVNATTGEPVAGARVRMESPANEVLSDADGRFQFLQVPPGPVRLLADAGGYCSAAMDATSEAGAVLEATFRLNPRENTGTTAIVRGVILHGQTQAPLADVQVSASVGGPTPSASTAADGSYELVLDADGIVELQVAKTGFDSVSLSTLLVPNQVFAFSPRLYPTGETPPDANRALIRGVVVNQANRQPIANALIVVTDPAGQQSLRSANDGRFEISALTGPEVRISISADAFDPARLLVPIQPLEQRDIGTVGLKPTAIDFYFPDLAIVDSTLSTTEPDLFSLSQGFEVEIVNRGTANVVQDFDLIGFVDSNGNGVFDVGIESEAGRVRVSEDLPIGGSATATIAVSAQLNFRDAPIAFLVDVENEVPEQDEDNNHGSSLLGCRVTPAFIGNDTIEEAWRWDGLSSNPNIRSLNQVPVVGQLTDDNGDGVINEYDIPDIVFVAAQRNQWGPASTALVAIDGRGGGEHWARTDVNLSHFSSLALGDIDNDGIAEIVGVRGYRQELIAFEHTGQLKWRVPLSGPSVPEVILPPPPYVYDQITIVNLEGDNEAEVIHGRQVFRGISGEKLWEGEHDAGGDGGKPINAPVAEAFGVGSIAADINMDGIMEVVAGRSAYDADGRTLWHRADIKPNPYQDADGTPMNSSGLNAIGNFDLDDFPEIVLSINDELYLLEHTGETIWGPKFAPDFGEMGAPSVADLDRDGLPEIMISSNERLTVFESDGTVKWTATIHDQSGVTSATVFDFENDGLYEVIHMDEEDFRIFDALTGARLYETRNTSVTVYEFPVVADIDGDKQAEIILTGFDRDFQAGVTPGIRVFKARNGAWADAGSVWGSQSFHINEVNEDSTVPLLETPSWLTHNTYRVQRSPYPDPLGMPDFSVGELRLIDQGPGRNPTVQVRVGNAGPVDAHEPPWIGVYRGDPAQGGVLLTETRLDTLRPARFQIVDLGEVSLSGSGDLYAVVDQRGRATECRETNNQRQVPFAAANGRGLLQLSTDRSAYLPGAQVMIEARVENRGGIAADFRVELSLYNAQNRLIQRFDDLSAQAVGTTLPRLLTQAWFSGDALGGAYRVEGRLLDRQNQLVSSASTLFAIEGSGSGASLRLLTDKASYRPGEPVFLQVEARNLSASELIRSPQILLSTLHNGVEVAQRTLELEDLFAGAVFQVELGVEASEPAGNYSVAGVLRSALTQADLASDNAEFERLLDASAAISGSVDAQLARLTVGQTQNCLMTVRNQGTAAVSGLQVRRRVMAEAGSEVKLEVSEAVSLPAAGSQAANQIVATQGYADGLYACVLEVQQGSGWRVLDSEAFEVAGSTQPGILVTPISGLVTDEDGASASFSVVLQSPPSALVRIALQPSDSAEWRLSTQELSFSPATWNIPRQVEVQGLDDDLPDGDQLGLIRTLPAQSADASYQAMDADDVEVTNRDNDGAQILVSPSSIETSEDGSLASIEVRLSSPPTSPVLIALRSSDAGEWQLDRSSLSFDSGNWNQVQLIEVSGQDDAEVDGTQLGWIELLPAQSGDPAYAGRDPVDVRARNLDNDVPEVLLSPAQLITSEGGPAQAFQLRLSAAPSSPVRIPIGPVDSSEWRILALEAVLTSDNWQAGVSVLVEPMDDQEADGDQLADLQLGPSLSSDPQFHQLAVPILSLRNIDNDGVQIVVTPTALVVSEAGSTAGFDVRLSEAPSDEVRIALSNTRSDEFSLSVSELRFAAGEIGPQLVQVTGIDDDLLDGNQAGLVVLAAAQSSDLRYHGAKPRDVAVTSLDDEIASIVVLPETPLITDETGSSVEFSLQLSAAPAAEVRVAIDTPDASEWLLERSELIFDVNNWQQAQTVRVTGVDDDLLDGDIQGLLRLLPAVSTDPRFNGIDPRDLPLINRDDEMPGQQTSLVVVPLDLDLNESGDGGRLQVSLSRAPSAPVQLRIESSDLSEVEVSPATLDFSVDNALQPKTVELVAVDDAVADGLQTVQIMVSIGATDDAQFAVLPPISLTARNADDDTPAVRLAVNGKTQLVEGESSQLSLWLESRPQAELEIDLTVAVMAGAPSAQSFSLTPMRVVIGPDNWQQPVSLRLSTRDDLTAAGAYRLSVQGQVMNAADPGYSGLQSDTVLFGVIDNDQDAVAVPVDQRGMLMILALALALLGGAAQLRRAASAAQRRC
ncbi:carboxypeptidase regulatory-like domain-containing protein [Pseudomarimonas arenosa]|uniref:Carboxypeptidase regulatory-like domain-containing protein n=1 Tax=Pseudomarimonas arenosa TaxID=2774145 RepID=A0AAW3ZM68_9GAMM|nr:carboxypeptidase regulatory-like domain-containing protein [Pseudomarimonas arenosa]MBD8525506.1 carboxypeptidase regulatory-like domain-containing protein [Pseudomarimonas arenosa]